MKLFFIEGFNLSSLLFLVDFLFIVGICGTFVVIRNFLMVLISLEIILFAINLQFIFYSLILDDIMGQLFALLVLSVAAAESAIGLAILVAFYRLRGVIAVDYMNLLKG